MRVNRLKQFLSRHPELYGQDRFHDEVGGFGAIEGDPQDLAGFGMCQDLRKTDAFLHRSGLAAGADRECPCLVRDSFCLEFVFSLAHDADLRVGEHDRRDGGIDHVSVVPGDVLGRDDSFFLGDVCQHVGSLHVTDSVDAGDAGAHVVVDDDTFLGQGDPCRFQFWTDVRPPSDRKQNVITMDFLCGAVHIECQAITSLRWRDRLGLRPGDDGDTSLLEGCSEGQCYVLILDRQDMRHELDDGDLRPDGAEECRHLDADNTATDDNKFLRLLPVAEDVVTGPDARVGERGKLDGRAAGGNDDVLRFNDLAGRVDADMSRVFECCTALIHLDIVLLHQEFNAFAQPDDDLFLSCHDGTEVNTHVISSQTKLASLLHACEELAAGQHCLGSDTTPVCADPAHVGLFCQRDRQTQLSCLDCSDVPSGSATDNKNVDHVNLRELCLLSTHDTTGMMMGQRRNVQICGCTLGRNNLTPAPATDYSQRFAPSSVAMLVGSPCPGKMRVAGGSVMRVTRIPSSSCSNSFWLGARPTLPANSVSPTNAWSPAMSTLLAGVCHDMVAMR